MDEHGEFGNLNRTYLRALYRESDESKYYKYDRAEISNMPSTIDLRQIAKIAIYNQGHIGSCTANAMAACYSIMCLLKHGHLFQGSRLFVYYNERAMEGKTNVDSGAFIKDGFTSLIRQGICPEFMWPYDESKFTIKPSQNCYDEGLQHTISPLSSQLNNYDLINSLKVNLSKHIACVIGVMVYESFESTKAAKTGIIPYPNLAIEKLLGGHALACIGYDDSKQHFIIQNSWGSTWGDNGYGYIPYSFIGDNRLCSDCHSMVEVEISN